MTCSSSAETERLTSGITLTQILIQANSLDNKTLAAVYKCKTLQNNTITTATNIVLPLRENPWREKL